MFGFELKSLGVFDEQFAHCCFAERPGDSVHAGLDPRTEGKGVMGIGGTKSTGSVGY